MKRKPKRSEPTGDMAFFDAPPLRHPGSKWKLADWLLQYFPPHSVYVEPYCGGAALFLRKAKSGIEVLNDIDGEIVNFFRVLRESPGELLRQIELTPYSREEYEQSLDVEGISDIERARRLYVHSRQSFGAGGGRNSGWRHQTNFNRGASLPGEWQRLGGLMQAARRLKDAQIECRDALWVIRHYDSPDTFFYVDPPYLLSTRAKGEGKRKRYRHEMTDMDHLMLLMTLRDARGAVMISGYDSPMYRYWLSNWQVHHTTTQTQGKGTAEEYIWLNAAAVDLSRWPLFGEKP